MRLKILIFLILAISIISLDVLDICQEVFASNNYIDSDNYYVVYDENFNLLFERNNVEMGDGYMSKDFKYYEVVYIDNDNKLAIAKYIREIEHPKVNNAGNLMPIRINGKTICMYMTHNDESYVPTDGVESIFGNGGIRDVAIALKDELENRFVDVYLDETLHIPHDSKAYDRSNVTANRLIDKYSPDAIFDIHRDGASRSLYVTKVNGCDCGRVRIVIGKANPNMEENEKFALYLMSVGNELYPWLFTDIYYAKGEYNQSLMSKSILFEMGSHLVEKDLEIATTKELADVIYTALFNTTINSDTGNLTVNGFANEKEITINNNFDGVKTNVVALVFSGIIVISTAVCLILMVIFRNNARSSLLKITDK